MNRLIPTAIVLSDGTTVPWSDFSKTFDHEGFKLSLGDSSIHIARASTIQKLMRKFAENDPMKAQDAQATP